MAITYSVIKLPCGLGYYKSGLLRMEILTKTQFCLILSVASQGFLRSHFWQLPAQIERGFNLSEENCYFRVSINPLIYICEHLQVFGG